QPAIEAMVVPPLAAAPPTTDIPDAMNFPDFPEDGDVAMKDASEPNWEAGEDAKPLPIKPEPIETNRGVLFGVVIYVSKALSYRETKILEVATSLGASHRWVFDDFVTHYVHQGRKRYNKDTKTALESSRVHVVSPQ